MNRIPRKIPHSLRSYLEQYQKDPERAIERLEKHLKRRGPDAVGHYLLAWLYHLKGDRKKAVENAWRAKIFAPGSPAMERLHYYMAHPNHFDAWTPGHDDVGTARMHSTEHRHAISDLDSLISRLSSVETTRIQLDMNREQGRDLGEEASHVDDLVTETLAMIHEEQKSYQTAIDTYHRLIEIHPGKREEYQERIERLKALLAQSETSQ